MNSYLLIIALAMLTASSPLNAKKHIPQAKRMHQTKQPMTIEEPPPSEDLRQVARAPRTARPIATGTPHGNAHKKKSKKGKAVKTKQLTLHVE